MHQAIIMIALEAAQFADTDAHQILGPGVIRSVRIEVSRAQSMQAEEQDNREEAESTDDEPVGENRQQQSGQYGGYVLHQQEVPIGRIDATGDKKRQIAQEDNSLKAIARQDIHEQPKPSIESDDSCRLPLG